ncbi:ADOP family duplicated permease [Rhodanobacter sp. Col0626]|uniref:ADOP family duplicated permease n=1 Tax=Rhodanobacter sp. Col0626 TaxID=3415679 RepID=UPI003CED2D80
MIVWLAEIGRAWRASLRRPGFLLLATGVLALGIGATSTVFTMIDDVLLKPLPYPESQQLVALGKLEAGTVRAVSPRQYQHLSGLDGVRSLGIYEGLSPAVNIAGDGPPLQVPSLYVDHGLLSTLGTQLVLGRNFSAEEDRPNGPPVAIISHGFWQCRFGGRNDVIGRRLQVEGVAHTIVGVLPASFDLGDGDVVLPTAFRANTTDDGTNYTAVARLADGVDATALAPRVHARLHAMYADTGEHDYWIRQHFGAQDLRDNLHADIRATLQMQMACALFLLLIALVNLTNLMLLRILSRSHEASVRSALGASAWRLALPSMAEGALVGMGGALMGLALAAMGLTALRQLMPVDWMPIEWTESGALHLGFDAWLLAMGVGLFSALLAAALGLWRGRSATSLDELREGGRSGLNVQRGRLGRGLVVAQMALATTLLCGAGLFLHSLYDASKVDLGFNPQGLLTFELAPVKATYPDAIAVQKLSQQLVDRLRQLPGVSDATVTTNLPAGDSFSGQFNLDGMHRPGGESFSPQFRGVGPHFFTLFDIHVRQGRGFASTDVRGGEQVAIVNQTFADHIYGGHAIGQLIQRGEGNGMLSARIVGVVADTYQYGPLDPGSIQPILYLPLTQMPDDALRVFRSFSSMRFVLKVHGDANGYRKGIRLAVAGVAPDQPIAHIRTMQFVVDNDTLSDTYFNLLLVGLFAVLAMLLAATGMYAVMAVAVAAREREFGVRSALGAPPRRLVTLVLRGALIQVVLGLIGGMALGFVSSSVLRAVIEGLGRSVFDPWSIGAVCVVIGVAGILACLAPALRAGRVQPMRALRGE